MLNTTKIKMIFFDAAGTLFHVRGSVGEIYARFAARYGQQVAPEFLHLPEVGIRPVEWLRQRLGDSGVS